MVEASGGAENGGVDPTARSSEPLHAPGAIQSHGCLIACSARDWIVGRVSDNLERFFGKTPEEVVGRPVEELLGKEGADRARALLTHAQHSETGERFSNVSCADWPTPLDVGLHLSAGRVILEFEESAGAPDPVEPLVLVRNVIGRLTRADDLAEYCRLAARQLRLITGYDRVTVRRFAPDGSGRVLAEDAREDLAPMVGVHYPAPDAPPRSRAHRPMNRILVIADVDAPPSPLKPANDLAGASIDLSFADLRALSPGHLRHLRDLGVAAKASAPILQGERLWGLFECHHSAPRRLSAHTRTACELFSHLFALQVEAKERADRDEAEMRGRKALDELTARISLDADILEQIGAAHELLSRMINADGVAILSEGRYERFGATLPASSVDAFAAQLHATADSSVFATDQITNASPTLAVGDVAGVLAIPISRAPRDYVLLFRRELARTVNWAGDPEKPAPGDEDGALPPARVDIRKETVRGQSAPWSVADLAIADALRVALLELSLRRADLEERARRSIRQGQDRLIAELNHRVKNMITLVGAIVRGGDKSASVDVYIEHVVKRLEALRVAHDQTVGAVRAQTPLAALVDAELDPFRRVDGPTFAIEGPDVAIGPEAIPAFSLVLHELATNAVKYGALSVDAGGVSVSWRVEDGRLTMTWSESGGPRARKPSRRGVGTALIEQVVPNELGGSVDLVYEESGLRAVFAIPETSLRQGPPTAEDAPSDRGVEPVATPEAASLPDAFVALLVEDNAVIALDLEGLLRSLGAVEVRIAGTVDEALALVEQGGFDVALLDVRLGAETSLPVAEKLAALGAPFAFSTGLGEDAAARGAFGEWPIVNKPYSKESVAAAFVAAFARTRRG